MKHASVQLSACPLRQGADVLSPGERIGVAEIGILATVGAAQLAVYRRPRVGVLSTGDEVVDPATQQLGPGQIRSVHNYVWVCSFRVYGGVQHYSRPYPGAAEHKATECSCQHLMHCMSLTVHGYDNGLTTSSSQHAMLIC